MQDEHQEEPKADEPLAEETPSEEAEAEEAVEEEIVPDDPEKVEQAERTLREANLARVRGHSSVADRLLKEAVELAPNTASVLEAVGDDFVARGQFRRAKEAYGKAHKIDPQNASVENKYGEMVLKVDLHIDPFAHAEEFTGYASPKAAMVLSLFIPGLGQFVAERIVKGWIMLGIHIFLWSIFYFIPSGMQAMIKYRNNAGPFEPFGFVILGICILNILWSVFDLTSLKYKAPKKVDSPVPPSEWLNR